jgi:hypothetical protein
MTDKVSVKLLEWHGPDLRGDVYALSLLGTYTIRESLGSLGYWLTQVGGYHPSVEQAQAAAQADYDERIRSALTQPEPLLAVSDEREELLAYLLQDELRNRLVPRIVDIAYSAFMAAKEPNNEDGGSSDWFTDTRPTVMKRIEEVRAALEAKR